MDRQEPVVLMLAMKVSWNRLPAEGPTI